MAEVVGFNHEKVMLMPYGEVHQGGLGCLVETTGQPLMIKVGHGLIGEVIDSLGSPLDQSPLPKDLSSFPTDRQPPNPMERKLITRPIESGIKVIDSLLTVGLGQRIGLFAGSGVGKCILLGIIAWKSIADIIVIELIGERRRVDQL